MKKLLITLLSTLILISLFGCARKSNTTLNVETNQNVESNQTQETEIQVDEIQIQQMKYMSSVSCVGENCNYIVYFGTDHNAAEYIYYKFNFIKGCDNYGSWFLNNGDLDILNDINFNEKNIEYSYSEVDDNCTLIIAVTSKTINERISEITNKYRPSSNEAMIIYYLINCEDEIYKAESTNINDLADYFAAKHGYCESIEVVHDENIKADLEAMGIY